MTCFYETHVISMKWEEYAKISHSKFWFLVVVKVMGVNIKLQEIKAQ